MRQKCKGVLWILLISSILRGQSPSDNFFFTSGLGSFHKRIAYIEFSDNKKEGIERQPLYTVGLSIGRNYRITGGLRLKFPLLIEYGYVKEEETYLWLEGETEKQAVGLRSVLYNIGILPFVQYLLRLSTGTRGIVSIGSGVFYSHLKEEEYKIDDPRVTIVGDDYLEESKGIILSASVGSGLEFSISPTMSIDLQYILRFSGPLCRETSRDLFPLEKKKYREFFLTHSISLSILMFKIW